MENPGQFRVEINTNVFESVGGSLILDFGGGSTGCC